MQKVITRICLTRLGVQKFVDEVNGHLEEGWNVSAFVIDKKLFTFVCYAILIDLPLQPEMEIE